MNAFCPSCEKQLSNEAVMCKSCGADFSNPDGWKPTTKAGKAQPIGPGPVSRVMGLIIHVAGRLVVGAATWLGFLFLAILMGFNGGYSAAQFLAVVIVIWAVFPLIKLFTKK